jgi:hypothetical protein
MVPMLLVLRHRTRTTMDRAVAGSSRYDALGRMIACVQSTIRPDQPVSEFELYVGEPSGMLRTVASGFVASVEDLVESIVDAQSNLPDDDDDAEIDDAARRAATEGGASG